MSRRGFTMVELLGVITVIAILAAILFPTFSVARNQSYTHSCRMNLLNIGMALRIYALDHDGCYPPKEDDLSPLYPHYLSTGDVFQCPESALSEIPMGAPADESIEIKPRPEGYSDLPLGWPEQPPPLPPPSSGPPPPPGPPLQEADFSEEILYTTYYYRAGRHHNELPRAPLVVDHEALHNNQANVLFSDGGIATLPKAEWEQLGFQSIEEILEERYPERHGPPSMEGPPPCLPPSGSPGGQP